MKLTEESVVVITGASSGIGRALALELLKRKIPVAICARRADSLTAVQLRFVAEGVPCYSKVCDVSNRFEVQDFIKGVVEKFGRIDVLINNAGRGNTASVEDTPHYQLESIFGVNVFSLFYTCAQVLPIMRAQQSGHIINIASVVGKIAYPFNSAYIAAKHAVVGFTAALRAELVDSGIEATVVCPAGVSTEWAAVTEGSPIGNIFGNGIKYSREISKQLNLPLAPLQPMMTPESVAEILISCIENPTGEDVYTHQGTKEIAQKAFNSRAEYDQTMKPLFLGMYKAYNEQKTERAINTQLED